VELMVVPVDGDPDIMEAGCKHHDDLCVVVSRP
jgi:hypothetical protein